MWLSRKLSQHEMQDVASAQDGTVTVEGGELAVFSSGEKREVKTAAPGGYEWQPKKGEDVLVVRGGTFGEEAYAVGAVGQSADDLAPGEVRIRSAAAGTEKATLAKGETYVDVPASAVEAGVSGNAIAGAIHLMSVYPVGITQCVNPEAFSGGSDEESNEKLRERVLASYKRLPNGANAAFYEQEAMSFPNVAAAKAVGRARGIGTVDVYVSTHAGAPDEKLLGEIEAVLQKKREIAVDVEVKAPTEKTVNMSAELTAEQGWTMQEITDAATAALQAYFTGERLGEAVYTAKLANILYGVEGVKNCHLLTPSADVSVSATELPVLGTVTITEIGAGEA